MATASEKINTQEYPLTTMGIVAPLVGWLIPGAGHLIQKKWIRGLLLMLSVSAMFFLGLMMEGKVYTPNAGDVLEMLGAGQGAINVAGADYGTKFIIVAGLLNIISAVDAHHIAIGKKS